MLNFFKTPASGLSFALSLLKRSLQERANCIVNSLSLKGTPVIGPSLKERYEQGVPDIWKEWSGTDCTMSVQGRTVHAFLAFLNKKQEKLTVNKQSKSGKKGNVMRIANVLSEKRKYSIHKSTAYCEERM
jgi:hypothetical protein